jgi:crossover junction endodeoxyribonuclease RuvC
MAVILGLDAGFASLGWAAVALMPDGPRLSALGVLRTGKGRASTLATEDNAQRARILWRGLRKIAEQWQPSAIAVESISWPRNAGVTGKMGIAWGMIFALAEHHRMPLIHTSPKEIKRAVTGRADASKEDVLAGLVARRGFGGHLLDDLRAADIPEGQWEHPVDAAAAIVAALDTDVVRALWRGRAP